MKAFDHIAIIYNPKSTGDAQDMALKLEQQLNKLVKRTGVKAHLAPTKHAKHAIYIAKSVSAKYKRPLLISVSGDGGYNEVINGAMLATKSRPVTAVLGAGNANDHRRVTRDSSIKELILKAEPKKLDLLYMKARADNFKFDVYAHSYIGLGFTSTAGDRLNKYGKSRTDEIKQLFKSLSRHEPVTIIRDKKPYRYDSIVLANINEMAKVVKLDDSATVDDGKLEVSTITHRSKAMMVLAFMRSIIAGAQKPDSVKTFDFSTTRAEKVQYDGEIVELPKNCTVTVTCVRHAIDSLY